MVWNDDRSFSSIAPWHRRHTLPIQPAFFRIESSIVWNQNNRGSCPQLETRGTWNQRTWYRQGQFWIPNPFNSFHADGFGKLIPEIRRMHNQIQGTSFGAKDQLCWGRPGCELSFALVQQDLQCEREKGDQGHTRYHNNGLGAIVNDMLPSDVQRVYHSWLMKSDSTRLFTPYRSAQWLPSFLFWPPAVTRWQAKNFHLGNGIWDFWYLSCGDLNLCLVSQPSCILPLEHTEKRRTL